jgi:hypothetical protein
MVQQMKPKYEVQVYHGEVGSIWYLIEPKPGGDFDIIDTFPSRVRLHEALEEMGELIA